MSAIQTPEDIYARRLSIFKEKCPQHLESVGGSFTPAPYLNSLFQIIYVPKHNFSYCLPSKTGSSTFVNQLFQILPVKPATKELNYPHIRLMGMSLGGVILG